MKLAKSISTVVICVTLLSIGACQTALNIVPGARALPGGTVANLNLTSEPGQATPLYNTKQEREPSRDEKVAVAIARSNKLCAQYITNVSAAERGLNTGLGVFSTLAHMGGILADGTGAKAAWSAYGAAADGVQGNVRKGIFKDNESTVLLAAMQTYRKAEYEALAKKIATDGEWKSWSYELLIPVIEEYHASCTISNAIIQVQKSVSQPK